MARKSKARRTYAKQAMQFNALRRDHIAEQAVDSAKLQQGSPTNTSRSKFDRMTGHGYAPRGINLEGNGKAKRKVHSHSKLSGPVAITVPDTRLGSATPLREV